MIFTSDDQFAIKLVFLDAGDTLIFQEKDSDIKGLSGLFPDGISFHIFYQLYSVSGATEFLDINSDGKVELVFANLGKNGKLHYIVHAQGVTLANNTVNFIKYNDIRFEQEEDSIYLVSLGFFVPLRNHFSVYEFCFQKFK